MAYKGYKVPAAEVDKNALAFINVNLAEYGQVPKTVVKGWNQQLTDWQNELLGGNTTAAHLEFIEGDVPGNVLRAIREYAAFKATKPGKRERDRSR